MIIPVYSVCPLPYISMIEKILRKIYRKIFRVPETKINVILGKNVGIKSSAILMTFGEGKIVFEGQNYVSRNVEVGTDKNISIGYGTSIQDRSMILGEVSIGKFCLIAPQVFIDSRTHQYDYKPEFYIRDQDEMIKENPIKESKPTKITIEDDCWIAMNAIVFPGVTIGRGSVVCAHSIVTQDVLPFSVVAGEPARAIKMRLDFKPKMELHFDQNENLPNFYKGFFLDMHNLKKDREDGGVSAGNIFTVYVSKGKQIKRPITLWVFIGN